VVGPGLAEGSAEGVADAEGVGVSDGDCDWQNPDWNEAASVNATIKANFFIV